MFELNGDSPSLRDPIWDALLAVCGISLTASIPRSARGAYNRAVKDLKSIGATPESISAHAAAFSEKWPAVSLTPTALVRRWNECVAVAPKRYTHKTESAEIIAACRTRGIDTVGKTRSELLKKLNG